MQQYLTFKKLAFQADVVSLITLVCLRMIQKCVERESAPLLQWSLVEQRNSLTGETGVKCALTVCFPYPRHLPTLSLTATDQKESPSVPWPQRQQNWEG